MPVFVNNYEIADEEIHLEMQHHPANSIEEARKEAAFSLIIKTLLLNAAKEQKLICADELSNTEADHEEVIEKLLSNKIKVPEADEETCKRYYKQHIERFKDTKTSQTLPFNLVRKHIECYLEDKGHQAAFSAYVDTLMGAAVIIGYEK